MVDCCCCSMKCVWTVIPVVLVLFCCFFRKWVVLAQKRHSSSSFDAKCHVGVFSHPAFQPLPGSRSGRNFYCAFWPNWCSCRERMAVEELQLSTPGVTKCFSCIINWTRGVCQHLLFLENHQQSQIISPRLAILCGLTRFNLQNHNPSKELTCEQQFLSFMHLFLYLFILCVNFPWDCSQLKYKLN